jgi:hypothetical protein
MLRRRRARCGGGQARTAKQIAAAGDIHVQRSISAVCSIARQ